MPDITSFADCMEDLISASMQSCRDREVVWVSYNPNVCWWTVLVGGCIPTPLKNMTSSIGMIRNSQYFWENKTWPNHQPVFNPHLWKLNFQWILVCCTVPWLSKFYVFFTSADPSVPGTPQVPSTWPGLRMVMTTLTTVMRIIIDEDDNYYSQLLFWHQYAIRVFVHNYCSWGSDIVNYDHYVFVNTTHIHIYIYIHIHSCYILSYYHLRSWCHWKFGVLNFDPIPTDLTNHLTP